MKLEDYEKLQQ